MARQNLSVMPLDNVACQNGDKKARSSQLALALNENRSRGFRRLRQHLRELAPGSVVLAVPRHHQAKNQSRIDVVGR